MGGANPYIGEAQYKLPTRKYKIKVTNHEEDGKVTEIEVDPAKIPFDHEGLPGSLLDILLGNGIELNHSCGGVCACSTCHVHVVKGMNSCNEANDDELDQLDMATDLRDNSRLGCQCVPDGSVDLEIEIPFWNRNAIRE